MAGRFASFWFCWDAVVAMVEWFGLRRRDFSYARSWLAQPTFNKSTTERKLAMEILIFIKIVVSLPCHYSRSFWNFPQLNH